MSNTAAFDPSFGDFDALFFFLPFAFLLFFSLISFSRFMTTMLKCTSAHTPLQQNKQVTMMWKSCTNFSWGFGLVCSKILNMKSLPFISKAFSMLIKKKNKHYRENYSITTICMLFLTFELYIFQNNFFNM